MKNAIMQAFIEVVIWLGCIKATILMAILSYFYWDAGKLLPFFINTISMGGIWYCFIQTLRELDRRGH